MSPPRHPTHPTLFASPTPIIHVVDDDQSFRAAVTRLLRAAKYEVRDYASASEFLDSDPCAGRVASCWTYGCPE